MSRMILFVLPVLLLVVTVPAQAYDVLWDNDIAAGGVGYLYTQFYSLTEDNEYWAPVHNAGADLDGDGILEFVTSVGAGASTIQINVIDSMSGTVEFSYNWNSVAGDRAQVFVYFDGDPTDGVSEVLIQSIYRCIVITGGTTMGANDPDPDGAVMRPLGRSVPNPFGVETTIPFSLSRSGPVSIQILDASGRLVRRVLTSSLPMGRHQVSWDGRDERGNRVASGVYMVRLEFEGEESVQKIVLTR